MTRNAALEQLRNGLAIALDGVSKLLDSSDPEEWVEQGNSPLGRRRHCELARAGKLAGARKVNGHWQVKRKVIDEYIDENGAPSPAAGAAQSEDADMAAILAFRAPKRKRRS